MSDIAEIRVAKQFSRFPAGRFGADGPNSGERFRDEFLFDRLSKGQKIKVYLDNVLGYGSSFLEEAFGGLVRVRGLSEEKLRDMMELVSIDDSLISEIWQYVEEESRRLAAGG